MGRFWGRLVGYFFLGTALALAVGPFNDYRPAPLEARMAGAGPVLVEGLALGRMVAAGVLLLAGVWVMAGQYKKRPGFNVSPTWSAILVDLIIVAFTGMGSFILLDWLAVQWFGVGSFLNDEAVVAVTGIMYLPALAILAGFACNSATQSLEVTAEGLTRHGPGRSRFISWEEIEGVGLTDTHLVKVHGDTALPRKLQTKLAIKTAGGEVTLFEPALKDIKREMLAAMRQVAPERLAPDLDQVAEGWRTGPVLPHGSKS